ncbi:MAG: deaminase [Candidatus Gracilibacteria bacterium]
MDGHMISKKDLKFLEIIDKLEPQALCLRAHIAALVVKNNKILLKHTNDWHCQYPCTELGCIRNKMNIKSGERREICYGICAEQWIIAKAALKGISLKGATLYCTKHPCRICSSLIAESGIKRVVYQEGYPEVLDHFNILHDSNVKIEQGPNTKFKKLGGAHTI